MNIERSPSRGRWFVLRSSRLALVPLALLSASVALVAACADSDDTEQVNEDGGTSVPASDAASSSLDDATSELDAEAGALPCGTDNLCPVAGPVNHVAIAAIAGRSQTDIWATGSNGTILHWDGGAWTALESYIHETITSLVLTPDEMWGTAGTLILHRGIGADTVQSTRIQEDLEPTTKNFRSIAGMARTPSGDIFLGLAPGWILSGYYGLNYFAKVDVATAKVSYQSDALDPMTNQPEPVVGVRAVHVVQEKALWLVGDRAAVVRYPITTSTEDDAGTSSFGQGAMLSVPSQTNLRAAWGYDDQLWVVGEKGMCAHYDGASWDISDTGTTSTLDAIFGLAPNDVWAVGENGTALHFDGTHWSPVVTGTSGTLRAVWGSSSGDVWFGGDAGLFHWGALP